MESRVRSYSQKTKIIFFFLLLSLCQIACHPDCATKYKKRKILYTLTSRKGIVGFTPKYSYHAKPSEDIILNLKEGEAYEARIYGDYTTDSFIKYKVFLNLKLNNEFISSSKIDNRYFWGITITPKQSGNYLFELRQDSKSKPLCYNIIVFIKDK
ncbi:hypothetical protein WAF17_08000 [Bernardetia sp. ABR2-2B]|uniref:hypothetical protein n=1 Tax=Bernardetia sp. ABR2-2B TaxID=3127472 RepID=UPI0030CB6499